MKMKGKKKKCFECVRLAFHQIHLVDKCLMVFMLVLLLQSAYGLFFRDPVTEEIGNIDVIIRTSSAAIFGYFLSANFIRNIPEQKREQENILPENGGEVRRQELVGTEEEEVSKSRLTPSNRIQIIIASVIGLFCLTVLILLRDMAELGSVAGRSASAAATVAQFRDFVSGCVGFLIGCPTHNGK